MKLGSILKNPTFSLGLEKDSNLGHQVEEVHESGPNEHYY